MREVVGGKVGGRDDFAAQFHEVTGAASFLHAADGVKTHGEKSRNVRLGLRPSAAPLLVVLEVPVPPGASCCQPGGTSETSLAAAAAPGFGYRHGQSIATANKACRLLKSAQCQLSRSERVKYGYWKLH